MSRIFFYIFIAASKNGTIRNSNVWQDFLILSLIAHKKEQKSSFSSIMDRRQGNIWLDHRKLKSLFFCKWHSHESYSICWSWPYKIGKLYPLDSMRLKWKRSKSHYYRIPHSTRIMWPKSWYIQQHITWPIFPYCIHTITWPLNMPKTS